MNNNISAVSDSSFEADVIQSKTPVLVDFWASWCNPCKALAPILDEIATDAAGKVKVVKMNIEENPATAPKFGVRSIPTLILFVDGQVQATHVGLASKSELASFIDTNI